MTVFLATLAPGIARASTSDGRWAVDVVLPDIDVRSLAVDPSSPERVWAGTQGAGIQHSSDAGLTWSSAGLDGMIVKAVTVTDDGRVYAGTKPPLLFVTEDGGRRWVELSSLRKRRQFFWFSPAEKPFTAYVQGVAVEDDVIVVGIEAGAVLRSPDRGETWQGHRPGALRDCHSLAAGLRGRFFEAGGSGGGAAYSSDGGESWLRPSGHRRHYGWAVAVDVADPDLWYFSSAPGVQAHSEDADAAIYRCHSTQSCEELAGGLPAPMKAMPYALITGPEPNHVTAGMSDGEVWESRDAGETWKLLFQAPALNRAMVRLNL
ncbi:MAG TPA: hypothetical protein VGX22_11200 [Candidatus Dormibacteraeota bacterium]|nr:hypothetical protein [Candidatus Dormibacteraeota bacterium]